MSQLSVAVAVPVALGFVLEAHEIVIFEGQAITGGTLSIAVITCVHVLEFPQASVARQTRVIVRRHTLPVMVVENTVGVTEEVQLSVAVAKPVLAGNVLAEH